MRRGLWIGVVLSGFIGYWARPAAAQEVTRSFGNLAAKLDSQRSVRILDDRGLTTFGHVTGVSSETVTIMSNSGRSQMFREEQVKQIDEWTPFTPWGTIAGGALGVGGGWLASRLICESQPGLLMAGLGALGAGLGYSADVRASLRLIYSGDGHGSTLSVSPIISAKRQGMMATVRW